MEFEPSPQKSSSPNQQNHLFRMPPQLKSSLLVRKGRLPQDQQMEAEVLNPPSRSRGRNNLPLLQFIRMSIYGTVLSPGFTQEQL